MILKKVGKLSFELAIILSVLICTLFINLKKVEAADLDVVLNEIMVDPNCASDKCEWIELYNNGNDTVNIKNWTFDDTKKFTSDTLIQPQDYLVVTKNLAEFNKVWTINQNKIVELSSLTLSNSGHTLKLENALDTYEENFTWQKAAGEDISWERIDLLKSGDDNWYNSLIAGGTPGEKNSVTDLKPPVKSSLIAPAQNKEFFDQNINFSWSNLESNLSYEFILSQNFNLTDPIIDELNIKDLFYQIDQLNYGTYFWQVIALNGLYETASVINTFEISEPKYCDSIIINELLPNPSTDQASGEWIELYNGCNTDVNLKGWILQDLSGNIHQYKISKDLIIDKYAYLVIFRSQSGITLNDDQDGAELLQPNGKIVSKSPQFVKATDNIAWARGPDKKWSWTTTPTPSAKNILTVATLSVNNNDDENVAISGPTLEIPTGDYRNYVSKIVKIRGVVTKTSGDTFYLDDGTGEAKVYIQAKTGIDKPAMHVGDIFEIIGIVDLYGSDNWRILPQKQSDIHLIEAVAKVIKTSTAKATTKKTSTNNLASDQTNSDGQTPKKMVAASNVSTNTDSNNSTKTKTSFWVQLLEMLIGLAIVIFIIFMIKLRKHPKEKVIGGHFGDDFT